MGRFVYATSPWWGINFQGDGIFSIESFFMNSQLWAQPGVFTEDEWRHTSVRWRSIGFPQVWNALFALTLRGSKRRISVCPINLEVHAGRHCHVPYLFRFLGRPTTGWLNLFNLRKLTAPGNPSNRWFSNCHIWISTPCNERRRPLRGRSSKDLFLDNTDVIAIEAPC